MFELFISFNIQVSHAVLIYVKNFLDCTCLQKQYMLDIWGRFYYKSQTLFPVNYTADT